MYLSEDAKKLLVAANGASGWIKVTKASGTHGLWFYVRIKSETEPPFAEGLDHEQGGHWNSVIHELYETGLIHPRHTKPGITTYKLTELGSHTAREN